MRWLLLLSVASCATWQPGEYRPLGTSGAEVAYEVVGPPSFPAGGVRVCSREIADHLTSRCIIVKEHGVVLEGEVKLFGTSTTR